MTEGTNPYLSEPVRPPHRGAQHYATLKGTTFKRAKSRDLFTVTITSTSEEGNCMKEQQLLVDLVFQPIEKGLKLRPAETQLLLAYISEILKEIEEEEKLIVAEQNSNASSGLKDKES